MIIMHCNLRWRSIVLSTLVWGTLFGCQTAHAMPPTREKSQLIAAGHHNEYVVLKYLIPALRQAGKAGRIYYAASCPPDDVGFPYYTYPFPKLNVLPPSKDSSGLSAVQDMFRDDTGIEVEENPPGVIRVRIGKVPDEILRTKLSLINLKPDEQYDGLLAIHAIEDSKEVLAANHGLDIHVDSRPFDYLTRHPASGLPHLPDSLANVTMDQALDVVARTLKGIVLYGTCTKQRYYTVGFTGGPGFDVESMMWSSPRQ